MKERKMNVVKCLVVASAALLGVAVAAPARAAWKLFQPGPSNYSSALSVTEGLVCAEVGFMSGAGDNQVLCSWPSGTSDFVQGKFLANGGAVPGGVKALAIFNTKTNYGTFIHVLGNDNYVRSYSGNQSSATWNSQPGFVNPTSTTQPVDVDTGLTLSIINIAAVGSGWLGGNRHTVMALASTGVAYTKYGNGWRKHPRLNNLGLTWKRVSAWGDRSDWVASNGHIYQAWDLNSSPGPTLSKLATYFGKIRAIGYPYILTNAGGSSTCNPLTQTCYVTCTVATWQCAGDADRVLKLVSGAWIRSPAQSSNYNPGMPGPVSVQDDGSVQDLEGPKNSAAIVDGRPFRGVDGEYFIHHYSNRWYVWIP
jgi:hypothetical protein